MWSRTEQWPWTLGLGRVLLCRQQFLNTLCSSKMVLNSQRFTCIYSQILGVKECATTPSLISVLCEDSLCGGGGGRSFGLTIAPCCRDPRSFPSRVSRGPDRGITPSSSQTPGISQPGVTSRQAPVSKLSSLPWKGS